MWNTLTAGLQMVQEKLDNVLDDSLGKQDQDEPDRASSSPSPPVVGAEPSPSLGQVTITDQPPVPSSVEEGPRKDREAELLRIQVRNLQAELTNAEQQTQLISTEYKRLLAEKEAEVKSLKKSATQSQGDGGGGGIDHIHQLEIVQKDLAVHKEMVTELRAELATKKTEWEELNNKAETKFNKLRTQAKNKIASLTKEMERLKVERGEGGGAGRVSPNTSFIESEDSASMLLSPAPPTELLTSLKRELSVLKEETDQKDRDLEARGSIVDQLKKELSVLKEETDQKNKDLEARGSMVDQLKKELSVLKEETDQKNKDLEAKGSMVDQMNGELEKNRKEMDQLREEVASWRNKLNVSEVCLKKEHEDRVAMELQVSALEEQMDKLNSDLSGATTERDELKKEMLTQKLENETLSLSVQDLTAKVDYLESQADRKGEKEEEGPTNEASDQHGDMKKSNPQVSVLAAGERGSLIDMESEIASLEAEIQQRDAQLSSFKTVLEDKEALVLRLRDSEATLTARLRDMESLCQTKDSNISTLQSDLSQNTELVSELRGQVIQLELSLKQTERQGKELQDSVQEKNKQLVKLEEDIAKTQESRTRIEQDLQEKEEELRSLSECIQNQDKIIEEKNSEVARMVSEIEVLENSVQLSNDSLRETVEGSEETAKMLESSSKRIQEVEQQNSELKSQLESRERSAEGVKVANEELVKELETLKSDKAQLSSLCSDLEVRASKSEGALEFAQEQLASKDERIKSLSETLKQLKATSTELESEVAQLKAQDTERTQEVLLKTEQTSKTEHLLEETREKLQKMESELKQKKEQLAAAEEEKERITSELQLAHSRLGIMEKEKSDSVVESETLRGQVESLSDLKHSLTQEQTRHAEEMSELKSQLGRSSELVKDLQIKLESARNKIGTLTAEKEVAVNKREELEAELARHQKETHQMKQQFDSAVKLMDSKLSQQAVTTNRLASDIDTKQRTIDSLKEQLATDSRKSSQMLERVQKVSADYKVSSERCRLLENERADLQKRVSTLEASSSQLQQLYSETQREKDAVRSEHEASLKGLQEQEVRVVTLTQQLAQTAREKHDAEDKLRGVTKQFLASEQEKAGLSSTLDDLRAQADDVQNLDKERRVWLEEKRSLERERGSLEEKVADLARNEEALKAHATDLETTLSQLQQELQESREQAEALQGKEPQTAVAEEVQRRLVEREQAYSAEISRLQLSHASQLASVEQQLKEEREKRKEAEEMVQSQRDVAISLDDTTPVGSDEPQTFMDYVNIGTAWTQRLVKNPNIVLTRLLRATPQTKLFFLAYFIIIHLLLLYLIIV